MNNRHTPPFVCADTRKPLPMETKPVSFWQFMAFSAGWLLAMLFGIFLLTPHGRALLDAYWGAQ